MTTERPMNDVWTMADRAAAAAEAEAFGRKAAAFAPVYAAVYAAVLAQWGGNPKTAAHDAASDSAGRACCRFVEFLETEKASAGDY